MSFGLHGLIGMPYFVARSDQLGVICVELVCHEGQAPQDPHGVVYVTEPKLVGKIFE